MASRVKLLPDRLINQIAAGEVVERPASILKELLDNSLDAGATRIEIEVEAGGKKLIRVTDNGCGLNQEELFLCLERHATSKLDAESDLMNIATLGFRGEALPSIGSVARLAITSSPAPEGPGHQIRLEGGQLLGLDPAPANQGTIVEVRDLFFNVPARRKFLKSEATEKAHLLDVAQRYALSRAKISLAFKDQGKTLLSVSSQEDIKSRAAAIMGPEIAQSLRPLSYKLDDLKIEGWLAGLETANRDSGLLFLYVLGRPVRDRLLNKAIAQGFGRALPAGRWPAGLINLDLDPRRVDVNVHPAKTEVRFREPGQIFQALCDLVARVVKAAPGANQASNQGSSQETQRFDQNPLDPTSNTNDPLADNQADLGSPHELSLPRNLAAVPETPSKPLTKGRPGGSFRAPAAAWALSSSPPNPASLFPPQTPDAQANSQASSLSPSPTPPPWLEDDQPQGAVDESPAEPSKPQKPSPFRLLGQLSQSYILAEVPEGLEIIDQHAAHERLLFNRLKKTLAEKGLPSQKALFPETIELTAHQILGLQALETDLRRLGFDIEPFGGSTYVIKGYPECLKPRLAKEALEEMLAKAQRRLKNLEGGGLGHLIEEMTDSWLDTLACRAAVKAGDKLTMEEMEALLKETREAEFGGFCPHGRPSTTVIGYKELESRFGRK